MMNSYEYVGARVADHRSMAERRRRSATIRSRRGSTQRLGSLVRGRVGKADGDHNQH